MNGYQNKNDFNIVRNFHCVAHIFCFFYRHLAVYRFFMIPSSKRDFPLTFMVFLRDFFICGPVISGFTSCLTFFLFKQQALYTGTSKYCYRRELFGFEFHSLTAMWKALIPGDIIVLTFMAIYHSAYA